MMLSVSVAHQAGALRDGDDLGRRHQPEPRVLPAQQRLEPGDLRRAAACGWNHSSTHLAQRDREVRGEREPPGDRVAVLGAVDLDTGPPALAAYIATSAWARTSSAGRAVGAR